MTPSTEFITGLKILEPFIFHYGFKLDNMKTEQASGGQFTNATYINGKKKLIIGYRYLISRLEYEFDKSTVGHNFYFDELGFTDKRHFPNPNFDYEDLQSSFKNILADFEYLKDDFFVGQCEELKKAAIAQIKYYKCEFWGGILDEYNLTHIAFANLGYKGGHGRKRIHKTVRNQAAPQIDEEILHTPMARMINITVSFE